MKKLLKQLPETFGPSGYEDEIRKLVRAEVKPLTDEIKVDALGNLIVRKIPARTTKDTKRIMVAAHMDEIGFIVSHITKDGFIRFSNLGGWWDQVLLAQRVVIRTAKGDVIGTIGAKPPHLLSDEERNKLADRKDMYIDVGATSREEVEEVGVSIADPILPVSPFAVLATGKAYLCKAFDDRAG